MNSCSSLDIKDLMYNSKYVIDTSVIVNYINAVEKTEVATGKVGEKENIAIRCVVCGKEKHLYVNLHSGLCHCFSCGFSANFTGLIRASENLSWSDAKQKTYEYAQKSRGILFSKIKDVSGTLRDTIRTIMRQTNSIGNALTTVSLPEGTIPITSDKAKKGRAYLKQRGYSKSKWINYPILYCPETSNSYAKDHLVFPCYDNNGFLTYYTTRACHELKKKEPKTLGPSGAKKLDTLLGVHEVNTNGNFVFLVEGPFDMLALPHVSVASLGKQVSEHQLRRIAKLYKKVFVCFDSDAKAYTLNAVNQLNRYGVYAAPIFLSHGDPGDYSELPVVAVLSKLLRLKNDSLQSKLSAILNNV